MAIVAAGLFSASSAFACSCFSTDQSFSEIIDSVDFVFLGTPVRSTPSPMTEFNVRAITEFNVRQTYKGPFIRTIFHPDSSTSCRLNIRPGQEVLVIGHWSAEGLATTSVCSMDRARIHPGILDYLHRQLDQAFVSPACEIRIKQAEDAQHFTGSWALDEKCTSQLDLYNRVYDKKFGPKNRD